MEGHTISWLVGNSVVEEREAMRDFFLDESIVGRGPRVRGISGRANGGDDSETRS
jgi:hypothetical protein